jgi:hypothetical protein
MENTHSDLPMLTQASFFRLCSTAALALSAGALSPAAAQQDPSAPLPDSHAEHLPARAEGPAAPDAAIQALMARLTGSYRNETHFLHVSKVSTSGMPASLYVELVRNEAPLQPMAQQIWTFWSRDGVVRARVSEFATGSTYGRVYIGAWASPDSFATVTPDRLDAIADLEVASSPTALELKSPRPGPVFRADAVEVEYDMRLEGDAFTWRCVGFGADGKPVWGDESLTLSRADPGVEARTIETGLVVIDLRAGEGPKLAEGDSAALHMDAYTLGGLQFYSTEGEPSGTFQTQVPSTQVPLTGWNKGVLGMQKGTKRRIIIPPWMGFDNRERPVQRPEFIPEGSWLVFDCEVVSLRDNTPEAPAPEAPK